MHKSILVGVDGSQAALEAVRWAAKEAKRRDAELRLVYAFGWMPAPDLGDPGTTPGDTLLRGAYRAVAAAAALAEVVAPEVEVVEEVLIGSPIPRLITESRRAQLVVVGSRGLGGFAGLLAGSVAVALAAHAECPVTVVRGGTPGPKPLDGPVLVGVDGSPTSEAAIAFAYRAAAQRAMPLVAVHTWQDVPIEPAVWPLIDWDDVETGARETLAKQMIGWGAQCPDVSTRQVVTMDRPAQTLVELSAEAQLVVVGSRGRGGVDGMALGSVGHALIHHAQCPVAVVPPQPEGAP
jgi:nucleotide-binding universal stress UspA family protein